MNFSEEGVGGYSENLEKWKNAKLLHVCESCGKTEVMTPEEAFEAGWDYPPRGPVWWGSRGSA